MNVQQAIEAARAHLFQLFRDESPTNVGLEEVLFDETKNVWEITFGFSRPWETSTRGPLSLISRVYKIIRIRDSDGAVVGVKNRNSLL